MRYSIINLPNINLGQLQIILAAAGLLSVLATVSCTLFLSAKCKDTLTVLLIFIVALLMPLLRMQRWAAQRGSRAYCHPPELVCRTISFISWRISTICISVERASGHRRLFCFRQELDYLCLHSWRFIPIADIR